MTRVATFQGQQSALLNLQRAQAREAVAGQQVASGRKADDLAGFGRAAEGVTALRSVQARVERWQDSASALAGRLEAQDLHLNAALDAAGEARAAIGQALALGKGDGLVAAITAAFARTAAALNAEHLGQPLFAGGRIERAPFTANSLSDLAGPEPLFANDQLKTATRLGETLVLQTGELASEVGGDLAEQFRRFQALVDAEGGALGSPLTPGQTEALGALLVGFRGAESTVTAAVVRNGAAQAQVEGAQAHLDDRGLSLTTLLADRTEVDMAKAVTDLKQAQLAVQATAQVFATLKDSSLLDLLR